MPYENHAFKVFGYLDLVAPHKLHDNQADQASFEASHVWKIYFHQLSIMNFLKGISYIS